MHLIKQELPSFMKTAGAAFKNHSLAGSRQTLVAFVIFISISLPLGYFGYNERSGWIKMTTPILAGFQSNSLLGYSELRSQTIFHLENVEFVEQVLLFSGARAQLGMYTVRAFYGFVASWFAPFVGVLNGLLLANYLSWALAAWAAWRFTKLLFNDDLAALISVIFVASGMGMIMHIGDYSAHLMSYTFYYLGVLIIYESKIWCESRPLTTHLKIGLFLALACLQYNTGIALTLGYFLTALKSNRWFRIGIAVIIALTAQSIWHSYLNILNQVINKHTGWVNFYATERVYLDAAIASWKHIINQGVSAIVYFVLNRLKEFFFYDSPLIVSLGLISLALLPRFLNLYWFFAVFLLLPLAAGLTYSPAATARGYLVYGVSLLVYSSLAGAFARYLRSSSLQLKLAAAAVLGILIISHIGWNTQHFWGNTGPAFAYVIGSRSALGTTSQQILSLTEAEPVPILFGGSATMAEAGLYTGSSTQKVTSSFLYSLFARSVYFIYCGLLLLLITMCKDDKSKPKKQTHPFTPASKLRSLYASPGVVITFSVFVILWTLSSWSSLLVKEVTARFYIPGAVSIPAGHRINYTINLSDRFIQAIEKHLNDSFYAQFFVKTTGKCSIRVSAGDKELLAADQPSQDFATYQIKLADLIEALRQSKRITLSINAYSPSHVLGWQRNSLSGRTLVTTAPDISYKVLPAFEIRLRKQSDGVLSLCGF